MIQIEQIHGHMPPELQERLAGTWGSSVLITRGRIHEMNALEGFIATDEVTGRLVGIALFRVGKEDMELVALDAVFQRRGIGTRLLESVITQFRKNELKRLWLVTTNDNTNAQRFYQKRGFNLCAFHYEGLEKARSLKPQLPRIGYDGIPMRHELEFEFITHK